MTIIDAGSDCLALRSKGIRLIVCKERRRPGAQLRFTDTDGMRSACFAANTPEHPDRRAATVGGAAERPAYRLR
jgi:hypothetical protein